MGVAHVGLVHRDPCECKVKGFRAVSFIERNVSKRRHLQGVRHKLDLDSFYSYNIFMLCGFHPNLMCHFECLQSFAPQTKTCADYKYVV